MSNQRHYTWSQAIFAPDQAICVCFLRILTSFWRPGSVIIPRLKHPGRLPDIMRFHQEASFYSGKKRAALSRLAAETLECLIRCVGNISVQDSVAYVLGGFRLQKCYSASFFAPEVVHGWHRILIWWFSIVTSSVRSAWVSHNIHWWFPFVASSVRSAQYVNLTEYQFGDFCLL